MPLPLVTLRSVTFHPWQLVPLLGAVQGVLLAMVLAARATNRTANRLLAVTVASFSLYLAIAAFDPTELVQAYPHLLGAAHPLPFLFGPLVYLYARCASDRTRRITARDLLHFVPFALVILTGLPIYMMSGSEKIALYFAMEAGNVPWQVAVAAPLKHVSGIAYTIATLRFLQAHRTIVSENYSSLERVNLAWLRWLVYSAAAIWLIATGVSLARPLGVDPGSVGDDVIAMLMTLLVYGIGYLGLRQPEIFRFDTAEFRVPLGAAHTARALDEERVPVAQLNRQLTEPAAPADSIAIGSPLLLADAAATPELEVAGSGKGEADGSSAAGEPSATRYERSGLTERQAARLRDRLLEMMEKEHPYRNAELTLADLAERLGTSPHKLSEVLNSLVGQSFYDFVNGYRVREVERRLRTPDASRLTFLTLALDAGFASKSTFNAVFKKHTGRTPSVYRELATGNSDRMTA